MRIRNKTLLIISATLITLTLVLNVLSRAILLEDFEHLQAETVEQNLRQALRWMQYQYVQLETAVGDWAPWDDTYQFVQDGNQAYIDSNLVPDTFVNLRLNLIAVVDVAGNVVYIRAFDLVNQVYASVPEDIFSHLTPDSLLLDHPDQDTVSGILALDEVPVLVASQSILKTNHDGVKQGTLIFGRYLDQPAIDHLSNEIDLRLDAEPANKLTHEDFINASRVLSESAGFYVHPLDAHTTAGYALLTDLYGQPSLILRVDTPNKIIQQGQASFTFFVITLLICGLAVGATIIWLLEKYVLSRLTGLEQRLGHIHLTGSFDERVDEQGSDELSSLARSVNLLLESIEKSQRRLRALNVELEHSLSELRLAQEQKDRFFNHAGHEFRTPLANLKTRLYLTRKKPDHLPEHLDILDHVTDQMITLVEDVFAIARYGKRTPEMDGGELRLHDILQLLLDDQQPKAQARGVPFSYKLTVGESSIYADSDKITNALGNILTYAVNYTPSAKAVSAAAHTFADEAIIRIECDDLRLTPESVPHIFQPFFRASEGGADSTGLSLTLAKEIIELHFGRLTFEANGQGGGTFTIKLLLVDHSNRQSIHKPVFGDLKPDEARQNVRSDQPGLPPGG